MGIKGLNLFLKKKTLSSFRKIPVYYFKGKRISFDSDNILRRFMSTAYKDVINKTDVISVNVDMKQVRKLWLIRCLDFFYSMITNGITPILVFDGQYPIEKSKKQEEKYKKKQELYKDVSDTKLEYQNMDILMRTPTMLVELRKKMAKLHYLSKDDKTVFINIISSLGIPCLFAAGEGEKLCSMLALENKVDAIYTKDTDAIVFGTPIVINEFGNKYYNETLETYEYVFECLTFNNILSNLELEYKTFVDLCIMSGCDYNENIYRVGTGNAYKILKKCLTIDNIPSQYDNRKSILNTEACRNLFTIVPSESIITNKLILDINLDISNSKTFLEEYNLMDYYGKYEYAYKAFNYEVNQSKINKKYIKLTLKHSNGASKLLGIIKDPIPNYIYTEKPKKSSFKNSSPNRKVMNLNKMQIDHYFKSKLNQK